MTVFKVRLVRVLLSKLEKLYSIVLGSMSLRSSRAQEAYVKRDSDLSHAAHQSTELAEIASGKSDFLHGNPPSLDFSESPLKAGLIGSLVCFILSSSAVFMNPSLIASVWFVGCISTACALYMNSWIGRRLESDFTEFERLRENWEVDNFPEGEIQEMVQIYTSSGVSELDALTVARILSKYKEFWVEHMLLHEIGIIPAGMRRLRDSDFTDAIYPHLTFSIAFVLPTYAISQYNSPWIAWVISLLEFVVILTLKKISCQWVRLSTCIIILSTCLLVTGFISKASHIIDLFT
jgi:hypothetical protein